MTTPTFFWPVPGYYAVSSGFNDVRDYGLHAAIDIPAPIGTPIVAVAAGRVAFLGWAGDCGMAVFIDHAEGWRSHYCHLNMWRVAPGSDVRQGQHIGDVGLTGHTGYPHLHFNLFAPTALPGSRYVAWVNRYAVDPLLYLGKESPEEDDMKLYTIKGSGGYIYVTDGLYKRRIDSPRGVVISSFVKVHAIENTAVIVVSDEFLDWLKPFPEAPA